MAPKSKKAAEEDADAEGNAATEESRRLTTLAYEQGCIAKSRLLSARTIKPGKGEAEV